MDKFIVNIIHRPEMVPEYSATVMRLLSLQKAMEEMSHLSL